MSIAMIIGVTGCAGAGKDEVGKYFVEHYGFTRLAFADEVKRVATEVFGWDGVKDERGRRLLQDIGATARTYNSMFWINLFRYKMLTEHVTKAVITDMRFLNEADFISSFVSNSMLIRVVGRGGLIGDTANHVSETEQCSIVVDVTVDNSGTLKQLYSRLDELYNGGDY